MLRSIEFNSIGIPMQWRRQRRSILISILVLFIITVVVLLLRGEEEIIDYVQSDFEREMEIEAELSPDELHLKKHILNREAKIRREIMLRTGRNNSFFRGIYVNEAYRISDSEIRLVYLANQDNPKGLRIFTPGFGWQPVEWFCFNVTCMDYLFCSMATRLGSVRIPETTGSFKSVRIASEISDEYHQINVRDVRPTLPISSDLKQQFNYPFNLGVCVQPIFFFTDWTILIQFFESWIAQGADKFYFYVHSQTWQTKRVLDFYKSSLGDRLELIDWSDVPSNQRDRGNYYKDPNARIFRHAATAFMHNCMLRARHQVKFISNTDLDDLPVAKSLDLLGTLNEMADRHPHAAQFKVDWVLSRQSLNWENIDRPSDVKFDLHSVQVMEANSIRWDYRVSKKMFHRPERVIHFDMHSVYRNEIRSGKNEFTTIDLQENPNIFFLHLRRFERKLIIPEIEKYNKTFDSSVLLRLSQRMMENYSNRIENSTFQHLKLSPWATEARQTMRDLEQCRLEAFGRKLTGINQICQQSSAGCEGMLKSSTTFLKSPMTWVNVKYDPSFNSYVENNEKNIFSIF